MFGNKRLLAAALALAPLATQAAETSYTFNSVSMIRQRPSSTTITGILIDDNLPMTVSFPAGGTPNFTDRCERLFGSMLDQPGTYLLTVTVDVTTPVPTPTNPNPVPVTTLVGCQLDVRP